MTKPTAVTEAGTAKVLLLADSTAGTPGANTPAAVTAGTSGEPTYPVGWLGVATHRAGDGKGSPGGFTVGTPMVAAGGFDNSVAGSARPFKTDENGLLLVSTREALDLPLQQPTGGVTVSAANETGITQADASRFSYLNSLTLECIGTVPGGTGAGSWSLKNGNGGTVLQWLTALMGTPTIGTQRQYNFVTPWKTGSSGGSFTLTPSSTFLGTWNVIANGFRSAL